MQIYGFVKKMSVLSSRFSIFLGLLCVAASCAWAQKPQPAKSKPPSVTTTAALLAACNITPYSAAAVQNMAWVFKDRSAVLLKLGLGDTKADVCHAMDALNTAHDPKTPADEFPVRAPEALYLAKLAILYRWQQEKQPLDPDLVKLMDQAFDVLWKKSPQQLAKEPRKTLLSYGIVSIREEALSYSLLGIYPGDMKDRGFAQFVTDFQEEHM